MPTKMQILAVAKVLAGDGYFIADHVIEAALIAAEAAGRGEITGAPEMAKTRKWKCMNCGATAIQEDCPSMLGCPKGNGVHAWVCKEE
jgi:rubrerythrin